MMYDKKVADETRTVDDIDCPLVKIIMERSVEDLMADYLDDDFASTVVASGSTLDFEDQSLFDEIEAFAETPYNPGDDR